MPENGGDPGEQRLAEIQTLARAYYDDPQMPIFATQNIKVLQLANALGNLQSWFAFATAVRTLHRASGRAQPMQEIKDYLADLKRVLDEHWEAADDRPTGRLNSVTLMLGSKSPFLVSLALLIRSKQGRIWFDDFLHEVRTDWRCDDSEDVVAAYTVDDTVMLKIMQWLMVEDVETLGNMATTRVHEAVLRFADMDHRDVLVEHIRSVPLWDGTERLRELMTVGFGAEIDEPNGQTMEYLEAVGRNWMISLVARGLEPGCKMDTMPVFLGLQGTFKSTAMQILGGPFYAEIHEPPTSKDFYLQIQGVWLGEIAELASIASTNVETTRVKAALSRASDKFRHPYARASTYHPRRFVPSGTGNQNEWMRDETGGRRFWAVQCGVVNLDWLRSNREQLLAEAFKRYEDGAMWWVVPEEAHSRVVERNQVVSVYEDTIRHRLRSEGLYDKVAGGPRPVLPNEDLPLDHMERWGNLVSPLRVIIDWLHIPFDQARSHAPEVKKALTRCGWKSGGVASVRVGDRVRSAKCWLPDPNERARSRQAGELEMVNINHDSGNDIPF